MEESSVAIAGSAVVASLADWVDLDGCLLLADDPFEGLELDADHRWILAGAARSRPDAPGSRRPFTHGPHRRSDERPFVWITWWTKSWTSPLPGRASGSYHWRPPLAETLEGVAGGGPQARSPTRVTALSGAVGPWFISPMIGA